MSAETTTCEIWVCLDSVGDYAVGQTDAEARENYEHNVQQLADAEGFRLLKVTLTVPLPAVVELTGTVPAQGDATLAFSLPGDDPRDGQQDEPDAASEAMPGTPTDEF